MTANWLTPAVITGSRRTAARVTPGAIALSSSSHFPLKLYSNWMKPVALPPGCAMLSTKPAPTGSTTATNTIGSVRVACNNGASTEAPEARITSGASQLRARLVGDGEGRPMIVTFATCVDSIRTIPFLQHDPDRAEDIMTDSEDHAADEWRYACMSRPYVPTIEKPKPKDVSNGYRPWRNTAQPGDWKTY